MWFKTNLGQRRKLRPWERLFLRLHPWWRIIPGGSGRQKAQGTAALLPFAEPVYSRVCIILIPTPRVTFPPRSLPPRFFFDSDFTSRVHECIRFKRRAGATNSAKKRIFELNEHWFFYSFDKGILHHQSIRVGVFF